MGNRVSRLERLTLIAPFALLPSFGAGWGSNWLMRHLASRGLLSRSGGGHLQRLNCLCEKEGGVPYFEGNCEHLVRQRCCVWTESQPEVSGLVAAAIRFCGKAQQSNQAR